MKIVIPQKSSSYSDYLPIGSASAISVAAFHFMIKPLNWTEMGLSLGALILFAVFIVAVSKDKRPLLQLDENGIFDERLGVGTILWSEIENVQIEAVYGNRFLCVQVRHPEKLAARMNNKKREKVVYHQSLGFRRFNIEIGEVDLSLLTLKAYIDARIIKQES